MSALCQTHNLCTHTQGSVEQVAQPRTMLTRVISRSLSANLHALRRNEGHRICPCCVSLSPIQFDHTAIVFARSRSPLLRHIFIPLPLILSFSPLPLLYTPLLAITAVTLLRLVLPSSIFAHLSCSRTRIAPSPKPVINFLASLIPHCVCAEY